MKHMEAEQQKQVVTWARWASKSGKYPMLEMLHCSLNGVKLSAIQASIAKAQGMLSGVYLFLLSAKKRLSRTVYRDEIWQQQGNGKPRKVFAERSKCWLCGISLL